MQSKTFTGLVIHLYNLVKGDLELGWTSTIKKDSRQFEEKEEQNIKLNLDIN